MAAPRAVQESRRRRDGWEGWAGWDGSDIGIGGDLWLVVGTASSWSTPYGPEQFLEVAGESSPCYSTRLGVSVIGSIE
ncbi:hypothetical protein GCM10009665_12690 [Kitasatospora nipponensis]|uniref:Immunity protein 22 of polymorphic toxin system n=1 Tax=Kitasatospora nipponensis TaxID=258049 RepID=A0ABP4GFS3_9ACTN